MGHGENWVDRLKHSANQNESKKDFTQRVFGEAEAEFSAANDLSGAERASLREMFTLGLNSADFVLDTGDVRNHCAEIAYNAAKAVLEPTHPDVDELAEELSNLVYSKLGA